MDANIWRSQHLKDGLQSNFVQTFVFPGGWILLVLVIFELHDVDILFDCLSPSILISVSLCAGCIYHPKPRSRQISPSLLCNGADTPWTVPNQRWRPQGDRCPSDWNKVRDNRFFLCVCVVGKKTDWALGGRGGGGEFVLCSEKSRQCTTRDKHRAWMHPYNSNRCHQVSEMCSVSDIPPNKSKLFCSARTHKEPRKEQDWM